MSHCAGFLDLLHYFSQSDEFSVLAGHLGVQTISMEIYNSIRLHNSRSFVPNAWDKGGLFKTSVAIETEYRCYNPRYADAVIICYLTCKIFLHWKEE